CGFAFTSAYLRQCFSNQLREKMPCQSFQSMVSYLPGAGKRSLPESRERPFPKARRYGREKYMGGRSGSGYRTNTGELFRAARGTGGFGEQPKPRVTARTDVFRLSFRPDVRLRPCSLPKWSETDAGTEQPVPKV
ncbi:hypothetical protein AAH155_23950, partial [Bacteroides uniformis]|uniref:hypothetical protein n=1 Tax=Bacteroides uniformis TaxID=820 RepID=UPI0039B5DE3A